jgi:hypothetical protein
MGLGILFYLIVGALLGVDRADNIHGIRGGKDRRRLWLACVLAWAVAWPLFLPLLLVRR